MLNRPSYGGLSKTVSSEEAQMSGRAISPSDAVHAAAATYGTAGDIDIPYGLQQLCHGQACIARLESLMPLQGKDQHEIFCFVPVVQEPVIPNLLKTRREHMHQIAADELRVFKGNGPSGLTGIKSAGRKGHPVIIHGKDAAVGDGDLMGISAKIFNSIAKAVESLLYVGAPVYIIEVVTEQLPMIRIAEAYAGRGKRELPIPIEPVQAGKEPAFEFIP